MKDEPFRDPEFEKWIVAQEKLVVPELDEDIINSFNMWKNAEIIKRNEIRNKTY